MSAKELLVKARELITDEKNWCGDGWGWHDNMCAIHAMCVARDKLSLSSRDVSFDYATRALAEAAGVVACYSSIGRWNDSHNHTEVLAGFDKAIASLELTEGS